MQKELKNMLDEWQEQNLLGTEELKYLWKENPTMPTIYFLPKVHKTLIDPPGRPIVSSCDSIYENISYYVDQYLAPMVKNLTSYVQDTGDFLRILSGISWNPAFLLVTIDVVSLYTSIDTQQDWMLALTF